MRTGRSARTWIRLLFEPKTLRAYRGRVSFVAENPRLGNDTAGNGRIATDALHPTIILTL